MFDLLRVLFIISDYLVLTSDDPFSEQLLMEYLKIVAVVCFSDIIDVDFYSSFFNGCPTDENKMTIGGLEKLGDRTVNFAVSSVFFFSNIFFQKNQISHYQYHDIISSLLSYHITKCSRLVKLHRSLA